MLTGENGILTKASTAKEETKKAQYKEEIGLIIAEKKIEKLNNTEETRALIELVAEGIEEKDWQRSVTICDEDENEDIEPSQGTQIIVETKDNYEIIVNIEEDSIEVTKLDGEVELITVTFDANDEEVIGTVPEKITKKKGRSIRLPDAENLRKEDYKFVGWSTNKLETTEDVTLKVGSSFKLTSNTTLYAIWAYDTKEISFNSNGGKGTMESINVVTGKGSNLPSNKFTKDGYKFKEWNTKADGSGAKYSNEGIITITENITLYAIWEEIIILGSINPTSIDVRIGTSPQITAISTNGKTINGSLLGWSSSDTNVVTVSNGILVPHSCGTAEVLVYSFDKPHESIACKVTVIPSSNNFDLMSYHVVKGTPSIQPDTNKVGGYTDIGRVYSSNWGDFRFGLYSHGDLTRFCDMNVVYKVPWSQVDPLGDNFRTIDFTVNSVCNSFEYNLNAKIEVEYEDGTSDKVVNNVRNSNGDTSVRYSLLNKSPAYLKFGFYASYKTGNGRLV